MTKLVVFDLDGTLYNSGNSFISAVKKILNEYNLEIPSNDFIFSFIGEPNHIFYDWLKSLAINETYKALDIKFNQYELEAVENYGHLYNSVYEVFDWLKLNGYTIGLCTNASKLYLEKVLSKFKLEKYFSVIKYPLNSNETKSEMLLSIKEEFKPIFAYMIGDRKHDFQAAKDNNFISVGVSYGYGKS